MASVKKAGYVSVMCCPECNFNRGVEINELDEECDDFIEEDGYLKCPCGCKFKP
jgi:methionine aminopeptidase